MSYLFGSSKKKANNDANGQPEAEASDRRRSSEDEETSSSLRPPPDEHTRLLPNRLNSDRGFLTPDDPAVSPYNLWTVRIVRYATSLFAAVSFVWWVLLLVSMFVTPPGFHTRGSGFFSWSYASMALFTSIFSLTFFGVPSKAVRVLSIFLSVMLFVNMIISLSVERVRHEEGWVGITSVIWALVMSLWALIADRTVQWGKAEEEERLTGRIESRRTVLEWTEVLASTIAYSVLAVVIVLLTMTLIIRSVDAGVAPPGKRYWVDGDKYQIHLYCHGNRTNYKGKKVPTVLFEGGELPVENGLWQLAENAVRNGTISRYCFADRPGFAWSDTAPSPMSASTAVDALSEALARADEEGPWVLASAGVGSLYSRIFSSRHGHEVRGMLLIDGFHEDLLDRIGAPGHGFMLWLQGILSPLGLIRIPAALFRGRNGEDRVWGRSALSGGKTIFAEMQQSLVADSLTKREVTSARAIQQPDTPLVVISSGVQMKEDNTWAKKQKDLGRITRQLQHWDVVEDAPHLVWTTAEGRDRIEKRLRQLVRG